jgi:ectoine hydroxylase-related dioxygenase (phytanoyl-CoA dioxygenase family)
MASDSAAMSDAVPRRPDLVGPTIRSVRGVDVATLDRLRTEGYAELPGLLAGPVLERALGTFDRAWRTAPATATHRFRILGHPELRDVVVDPRVLAAPRALFGEQAQLIEYHLILREPAAAAADRRRRVVSRRGKAWPVPPRDWHRDFSLLTPDPLMVTIVVFLDGCTGDMGPTRVVPGSHLRPSPAGLDLEEPHPDEVELSFRPGDGVLLHSSVLHSRGENRTARSGRGLVMYFGYWWIKQVDAALPLPPGATDDDPAYRRLIGEEMPGADVHIFRPLVTTVVGR